MEVHPPHEPVHSWRDALTHIGLMTVGLFIALMLEAVVEYFHHKELVAHARETIRQELKLNNEAAASDIAQIDPSVHRVQANIAALQAIADDPASKPRMSYEVHFSPLSDTAWRTARETGALGYMPYEEVQSFAGLYGLQVQINSDLIKLFDRESESLGPVISADDYRKVSREDLQFAIRENGIALVDLYSLKQLLQGIQQAYAEQSKLNK